MMLNSQSTCVPTLPSSRTEFNLCDMRAAKSSIQPKIFLLGSPFKLFFFFSEETSECSSLGLPATFRSFSGRMAKNTGQLNKLLFLEILSSANLSPRGCVNPSSWLSLGAGTHFTKPLKEKYAFQRGENSRWFCPISADCTWDFFTCTRRYGKWPDNKPCCQQRFDDCCMFVMGKKKVRSKSYMMMSGHESK